MAKPFHLVSGQQCLLLEQAREADDRVERRPQLVTHAGQKLAFQRIDPLHFMVASLQRIADICQAPVGGPQALIGEPRLPRSLERRAILGEFIAQQSDEQPPPTAGANGPSLKRTLLAGPVSLNPNAGMKSPCRRSPKRFAID